MMRLLEKDGRTKIIDIARKLNLSGELVLYKLKKLQKDKVIIGSRIVFDMRKLGYFYSAILLNIKNLSVKNEEKIKEFARSHSYIHSLGFSISKPNCFIQVFHKTEKELRESLTDILTLLEEEVLAYDLFLIDEEEKINTIPFI